MAEIKRIYRSRTETQVAGICGGLGSYMNVDPVLIRLILLAVTIATGVVPGVLFYLVAWLVIPQEPLPAPVQQQPAEQPPVAPQPGENQA